MNCPTVCVDNMLLLSDAHGSSSRICIGERDKKVRLITSDMKDDDEVKVGGISYTEAPFNFVHLTWNFSLFQILGEHRDYINSISFHPEQGDLVASAGDDYTCRVWSLEGREFACFPLGAPGMSVCWHSQDPGKVRFCFFAHKFLLYC